MQYTLGAVELPLRCAAEADPQDKASDFVRDGQHQSDPRKALYDARMECYSCVIEALAMFDELLDKATASGNGERTRTEMWLTTSRLGCTETRRGVRSDNCVG
jgi:hypothetical protein